MFLGDQLFPKFLLSLKRFKSAIRARHASSELTQKSGVTAECSRSLSLIHANLVLTKNGTGRKMSKCKTLNLGAVFSSCNRAKMPRARLLAVNAIFNADSWLLQASCRSSYQAQQLWQLLGEAPPSRSEVATHRSGAQGSLSTNETRTTMDNFCCSYCFVTASTTATARPLVS